MYWRGSLHEASDSGMAGVVSIELINWPFLHDLEGTPAEYLAGLKLAIERLPPDTLIGDLRKIHPDRVGVVSNDAHTPSSISR
jgi:hypothetical protein